ncbi:MAG: hypothetical protein ABIP74_01195 [Candidatus Saccharimonas sp.]
MFGQILCKIGLHKRGKKWNKVLVWHEGEYPWETWTHFCHAYKKSPCARCGLPAKRRIRYCTYPIYEGPRQKYYGYDWSEVPSSVMALITDR